MDKRKRLKRLPPKPEKFAFDIETMGLNGDQWTPKQMEEFLKSPIFSQRKMANHASVFNMIPSQFTNRMLRGNSADRIIFDEIVHFPDSYADKHNLTTEEWRWAVAFNVHLGVNDKFYATKSPEDRRRIEQEYEALAHRNTVNGKRAAKVVAHRTAMIMNEEKPRSAIKDQMDAYRYLYGSMIK